ncbi:hypothetical protein HY003_02085 [Candidatus Saccharibacteria bacterium]|nr:hypothetical protein [Candidatus Saccharibacteria bacterium]MBI3338065.1 hypothetical protein [Candidatus Saccharibacteria bacterium]
MNRYDYMIAGRWRNHENIRPLLEGLRKAGKKVYCFLDNAYDGNGVFIDKTGNGVEDFMTKLETTEDWQTNSTFRKIYENDMNGLQESKEFILVFPAGLAAHMELGVAFGGGKKCYGIGEPEKYETLYLMFDKIFPDSKSFLEYAK